MAFSAKTRALIDSVSRSSISMNFLEQRTQKKCKKESFWTLSFPPNGALDMPASLSVAATGPIELVEFVRRTDDGSIAADCSSGTCQCSAGFIGNGNGCEEMTEEQAATTQAPVTTQAASSDSVRDWIPSLINKVESVFEDIRPGKPRTHLMNKWQRLSERFVRRFESMSDKGCDLAETFEDNTIDFNTVDTCEVSFIAILKSGPDAKLKSGAELLVQKNKIRFIKNIFRIFPESKRHSLHGVRNLHRKTC